MLTFYRDSLCHCLSQKQSTQQPKLIYQTGHYFVNYSNTGYTNPLTFHCKTHFISAMVHKDNYQEAEVRHNQAKMINKGLQAENTN